MNKIKEFSFQKMVNGRNMILVLHHAINEDFEIPINDLKDLESIQLDMSDVAWINSEGTRRFSKWLFSIEENLPSVKLQIEKLRPVLTRQFNMIRTFFGKNAQVFSVFVPFYCETCDLDEQDGLIDIMQIEAAGGVSSFNPGTKVCQQCGGPMDLDVADNYFSIMLRKPG